MISHIYTKELTHTFCGETHSSEELGKGYVFNDKNNHLMMHAGYTIVPLVLLPLRANGIFVHAPKRYDISPRRLCMECYAMQALCSV